MILGHSSQLRLQVMLASTFIVPLPLDQGVDAFLLQLGAGSPIGAVGHKTTADIESLTQSGALSQKAQARLAGACLRRLLPVGMEGTR